MREELCFNELYNKYSQYDDWYRGGYCKGFKCPNYNKCKGNSEFDKLTKHTPTDYDVVNAINKERAYGVWDREKNNY